MRFYRCKYCGNIITKMKDASVPVVCCGTMMEELIPGSVEAAVEKHVPVITVEDNKVFVTVGEVEHPMVEEHFIEWITIQTKTGTQTRFLSHIEAPAASFRISSQDQLVAVYAYCNLHGLWYAEPEQASTCAVEPANTPTNEDYVVCRCNNVKYFDILNAAQDHKDLNRLLSIFDEVKNTTHCATGCGGCYNKVLAIISDILSGQLS